MPNNWVKSFRLNVHVTYNGFGLMLIALTQIAVAIQNAAEALCIRQTS